MILQVMRLRPVLFVSGFLAVCGGASVPAARQASPTVFEVSVERFSFTPSEIRMKNGTSAEIRLRSEDTDHGFRVAGTNIDITIPKRGRGVATVRFEPEKPGRYEFECSKLCGAGHDFMRGTIIVE